MSFCFVRQRVMMAKQLSKLPRTMAQLSCSQYHQQTSSHLKAVEHPSDRGQLYSDRGKHPYLIMYPWRSFQDFVNLLQDNIIYEDEKIIAIDKPWGVGIWSSALTVHKTNAHLLQMESFGNPHFCIADAIPELELRMRLPSLQIAKALDRFQSGVIILSKGPDATKIVKTACRRGRAMHIPFMTYWCLCRGYPVETNAKSEVERVAIRLCEVDELGDYKEPVIISDRNFTKRQARLTEDFKIVFADCRVLESNTKLSASLLQISCNSDKWRFVQTYAAYRTSFILGDYRFSRRVGQLLGNPITLTPQKLHSPGYSDYEPLHVNVRRKLRVARNAEIPLMIHRRKIILPLYLRSGKTKEHLVIESRKLPPHFEWTAKSLKLLSFNPEFISEDE